LKTDIVTTADGSHTLYNPDMHQHYHSKHGAVQESVYVFIEKGLKALPEEVGNINILEIGLGTGLNVFLTFIENIKLQKNIKYTVLEAFPVKEEVFSQLNYPELLLHPDKKEEFFRIHNCEWAKEIEIWENFHFIKLQEKLEEVKLPENEYDVIYFDAFSPSAQPELWTQQIFAKMLSSMRSGGILVTYCAKGDVRRNMQAAGFLVEKLPGPPGKREMLRARKQ
jgi:tRNA U34 5-methylaminomethyl-2-thiouridine-forming methyltransferase MnmC